MRLDIYRRHEAGHKLSYLAVPAGKPLPQEVTNVDWESWAVGDHAVELDEEAAHWDDYGIAHPGAQIAEKRYAITALAEQQPE